MYVLYMYINIYNMCSCMQFTRYTSTIHIIAGRSRTAHYPGVIQAAQRQCALTSF